MLKKYVSKFTIDILPSVLATIIGAYIVNHYIVAKPADAPVAAAVSTPDPAKAVASIPEAGVKAKGISERAMLEKTATEKPAVVDKPADTASLPAEPRRHQPVLREKAVAKAVQTPAPAAASVEAAAAPEDKRDATDLARAAIERLRGANDPSPRVQEAVRIPEARQAPETPHLTPEAPHVASAPSVQPLPPPIMVSAPSTEASNPATGSLPATPPYAAARIDDPRRPTPPADIPSSAPVELRAEATLPAPREPTSVADDVLSAAKSVFHAVLRR
ncbi:MAG: hypothetical protein QOJ86_4746 [Bradyrhizobium sp.]|jgi:hypothetical protein|nr:hypothetical protein [Bradyrhizobium sp.]